MANSLSLMITVGASAGAAFSVFGNLKGVMQRVAAVTKDLKARQGELGAAIKNAAKLPQSDLGRLNEQYALQQQHLTRLRASTQALGRSQAAIAANEANRANLRGKMMETAALGYMVAAPIRIGVEFEKSMSKVQALTRLDKDSEEMKALTAQARQLGAATSFTASEAAQAQGFLAMAGFKTQQILESMPSMLDLAKAGDMDLQRTADIASNIQTAYGIDSSQMTRVADVLTAAFTNANVDLNMLSQTMKYMGPVAKEFGMSLEESAAMAGLLGNAGIQADMAGTALRGLMSKLSGPKVKAMKALGIATADAAGNMRPLPEILQDLSAATGKMGEQERIATIFDLFDQRVAPAVLALMGQKDKIQAAIDTVTNSAGAAAKTHQIMADNTWGALKTLQSAWEDLAISLTNTENGPFRQLIESLAGILRGVSRWVQNNPVFVGGILKLLAAILAFKVGLLAMSYAASLVAAPILHLIKIWRMFQAAMALKAVGGMATVFPKLSAAATGTLARLKTLGAWLAVQGRALFAAFWISAHGPGASLSATLAAPFKMIGRSILWLSRLMLTTPIGLIITGIALAAFLIYKYWGPIKAFFAGVWEGFLSVMGPVVDSIRESLAPTFGFLSETFSTLKALIAPLIEKFWAFIAPTDEGSEAVKNFGAFLGVLLGMFIKPLVMGFTVLIRGIVLFVGAITSAVSSIASVVSGVITTIKTAFAGGLSGIAQLILNWSPIGLFYSAFAQALSWFGIELPAKFTEFGKAIIDGLINGITSKITAVQDSMSMAIGDTVDAVREKLGIASPSKVMMEIGGFAMQGLSEGLSAMKTGPMAQMAATVQGIMAAAISDVRQAWGRPRTRPSLAEGAGAHRAPLRKNQTARHSSRRVSFTRV
jgi:TP901 family phage tail tape measure protein